MHPVNKRRREYLLAGTLPEPPNFPFRRQRLQRLTSGYRFTFLLRLRATGRYQRQQEHSRNKRSAEFHLNSSSDFMNMSHEHKVSRKLSGLRRQQQLEATAAELQRSRARGALAARPVYRGWLALLLPDNDVGFRRADDIK